MQKSNFEKDVKRANLTLSNGNVTEKSVSNEENKETIDPTIIRELQERITKEILNSKLEEKDMQELKVNIFFLFCFFIPFYVECKGCVVAEFCLIICGVLSSRGNLN